MIYHYVNDTKPKDCSKDMTRTMLLAHYPANDFLSGKENPHNQLLRGEAVHKLRCKSPDAALFSRKVDCNDQSIRTTPTTLKLLEQTSQIQVGLLRKFDPFHYA